VPKWLGPLSRWPQQFKQLSELGYNTIHFVPPQERGASNSPYSIQDQLSLSNDLFDSKDQSLTSKQKWEKFSKLLAEARESYGFTYIVDIVLNHTAHTTPWLEDHPEAGYNLENSPHLISAEELDLQLVELSGKLESLGLPTELKDNNDLNSITNYIKNDLIKNLKLHEYYAINREKVINEFKSKIQGYNFDQNNLDEGLAQIIKPSLSIEALSDNLLHKVVSKALGERDSRGFDLDILIQSLVLWKDANWIQNESESIPSLEKILEIINFNLYKDYDADIETIITMLTNTMKYERLDDHGPKKGKISPSNPLIHTYFTRLPKNDKTSKHNPRALALANNGWVWAADPKLSFIAPESRAYLTRSVIVWSDCVKLRFGEQQQDSEWLWSHIKEYTQSLASNFQGFRIDNCHSTPIPVAEFVLDTARQINPNLYVIAELFTGSEDHDRYFMCKLGINSLIRESMQAPDPHELSRLIHKYGGLPVGSLNEEWRVESSQFSPANENSKASLPCNLIPIKGRTPHALFFDCTHDNETPHQKRHVIDTLPNAAVVAMTYSSIGSVMGYDHLYPALLNLVEESRLYKIPQDTLGEGIAKAKQLLNNLHFKLSLEGYTEIHVHHESNYLMVNRQNPNNHEGYLLIANTKFHGSDQNAKLDVVKLRKSSAELIAGYKLVIQDEDKFNKYDSKSSEELEGLPAVLEDLNLPEFETKEDGLGKFVEINLNPEQFPQGSIIVLKTKLDNISTELVSKIGHGAHAAVQDLDLNALNFLLYRIDSEERDLLGYDRGTYHIPSYGNLIYSGLQGIISVLKPIMNSNDLGHPLCDNLRQGTWLLDYTVDRLKLHLKFAPNLTHVIQWLQDQFDKVKLFPNFLIPKYFSLVVFSLYEASTKRAWSEMNQFVQQGDNFIKYGALTSIQLRGLLKSSSLDPRKLIPGLAAGLPHFSNQYMRCWGRDTFISLRGLFLTTGNFEAARDHLLAFASSLKHGLIPNLLDSVRLPRYNSRDSVWWYLQSLQDYCKLSPEGLEFLGEKVALRFPSNDDFVEFDDPRAYSETVTVAEVVQTAMKRHYSGIEFREWNAGPKLDSHMTEEGFNIKIHFDPNTGLLFGGNTKNCGTWMDKMGESTKAGTMGVPASPRDGAPIEIIGMLKSTVSWLSSISKSKHFKFDGVTNTNGESLSYSEWDQLLQTNFEKHFYVPQDSADYDQFNVDPNLIHRGGIYKDVLGSEHKYTDYQLRPNFLVAMVVAPELFTPSRALGAIEIAENVLVAPKGMKTLDPKDSNYRGDYDNSNDSDDKYIAKGFNYHQGPEWGWPLGYYLMASYHFRSQFANKQYPHELLIHEIQEKLIGFRDELLNSKFAGIPELTNSDGKFCRDSCATQAWSTATALDALYRVHDSAKSGVKKSGGSGSPTKSSNGGASNGKKKAKSPKK
jgi:glycogen debranching enzyme